jgi:Carboxypeptidase regulatory-like domain
MNAKQESNLNMCHSVLTHCETNAAITSTVTAYSNAIATLKTTLSAISSTVQQQLRNTKGITISKGENKQSLASLTVEIAGAVFAYASDIANTILKNAAKITVSELLRSRDEEMGPRCSAILKLAQNNKDELKPYGITDAVITSLQAAIDAYTAAVPAPRNAAAQNAAYRETLKSLFKTANSIIKEKLDKLSPVTSAATGEAIKDAAIEISGLGIVIKSNAKGDFAVKPLPFGEYSFTISKEGFASQTITNFKITQGVINKLEVALK